MSWCRFVVTKEKLQLRFTYQSFLHTSVHLKVTWAKITDKKDVIKTGCNEIPLKIDLHWNAFSASEWACFSSLFSTCFIVFTNKKLFLETLTSVLKYLSADTSMLKYLTRPTPACFWYSEVAWCKSGTRTPGPGTSGRWDPVPPSKFKNGTRDSPKV